MLIYVRSGKRRYGDKPISVHHQRRGWEFQAVLRGSISPVYPAGGEFSRKKNLWLFSPEQKHGWTAEAGSEAEIVVFHFVSIPEPLLSLACSSSDPLETSLTNEHCLRLLKLARKASHYWTKPSPATILCHKEVLLELSLLIYEAHAKSAPGGPSDRPGRTTVQNAIRIFQERLEENLSQEELARQAGTSASHLRRLFHEVMQSSPKKIFDQIRFQRALELMSLRGRKLESVGEACGFSCASTFSRAFKTRFGCPPDEWPI